MISTVPKEIKIIHGDCLLKMNQISDKSIDLILCDLPYWTTNCKWDSVIPLDELWSHYERIIKDNGVIILTAQTPFDKVLWASNISLLKYEWIWEKTTATWHLNAKKMPMKSHENILVFYKMPPTYNPQKTLWHTPMNAYKKYLDTQNNSELYMKCNKEVVWGWNTDRYPRSIQVFKSDKQKCHLHPTQKPLALFEYLIRTYTNEWDLVLDNCAWSWTTGMTGSNIMTQVKI